MTDRLPRKLAAILYADVAGYSRLTGDDEDATHKALGESLDIVSTTIQSHHGQIMHFAGDAVLARFDAVFDAVSSAVDIQEQLRAENTVPPDHQKLQFRIGVNLGDVIEDRGEIYGDGVNIAARLESIADPGGVCVSASVFEQIRGKMDFQFEDLGVQTLKNIAKKIKAYRVVRGPLQLSPKTFKALTGERLELSDIPSVAVLPFQNMSGDPEQDYLADGMSEDIITALSRVPNLVVISRNSTFVYKERIVDVRQVGRELAVSHVLEGSIRKLGNRIRISAQLVDSRSGNHVWAERFDRNLGDIFAIQDEITHSIVVELQVNLVSGEYSRLVAKGTDNVEAWELGTRSKPLVDSQVRDDALAGRQLLGRALEIDGSYSVAWTLLGWTYLEEVVWGWVSDPGKSMRMANEAVHKALEVDPPYPGSYSLLGHIHMVRDETEQAIAMCEKAVDLAPGDSGGLALLGNILIRSGRLKEGIQKLQRAIRLSPYPPTWYLSVLGSGYHLNGENDLAIIALEQSSKRESYSVLPRLWLASALIEAGRTDEAGVIFQDTHNLDPTLSIGDWVMKFVAANAQERIRNNLLQAGFPE